MAERFKYEKRYWYPHMKPRDVAIWERFLTAFPDAYDECEYDVLVGSPPPFDPTVNDITGGEISDLYKKKIDVVAYKKGETDIIEIKPNAGAAALGQVLGYVALYKRDIKPSASPRAIVLTDMPQPDMDMLSKSMGVTVITV